MLVNNGLTLPGRSLCRRMNGRVGYKAWHEANSGDIGRVLMGYICPALRNLKLGRAGIAKIDKVPDTSNIKEALDTAIGEKM